MCHGWTEIEGETYLFDKITGVHQPGWRKENNKIYFNVNGEKYSGEKYIEGNWYYFSEETTDEFTYGEMVTGWSKHSGHKYYYDKQGHMVYGWYKINNTEYYFEKVTGINVGGFERKDGKTYFYLENGKPYAGEKRIDGHWYCFNSNGEMITGWHNLNGKKVYYGSDGIMKYGEQRINGKWYYFNNSTGAMVTGWYNLPGKKVYYGSDGAMVYGTQTIGGKVYKFNTLTGALITSDMAMKAQSYSSNTRWLILVDTKQNKVGIYQGSFNNWNEVNYWSCTSGAVSTPTVKGEFRVTGKGMSFGSGYTCWYYTQFYGNYLFHSVLYKQGSMTAIKDGRLGINASHGCVRLDINNAKWIYDNIPYGTKVVIY